MSQNCRVCGGTLIVRLLKVTDFMTGDVFSVQKCKECGLGHTVPQPEDLNRYYSERYYGNRHSFTAGYCMRRRLKFVASLKSQGSGRKLLDVGCGDGSFLLAARDAGWGVAGVEINPDSARDAGLGVYEEIGQVSGVTPFDCITMWHSLEHMEDVKSTLFQLSKLLKPDGILFVAVPDHESFQSKVFRSKWIPLDVPRHLYHFDSKSLDSCIGEVGLSIRRKWHTEVEYDLMGWSQSALNCIFSVQNVFLDQLAGKPRNTGVLTRVLHIVLGSILTVLAVPFVAVETCFCRGGTLVIAAGLAAEGFSSVSLEKES